jgi:adenylosuccinate synthase
MFIKSDNYRKILGQISSTKTLINTETLKRNKYIAVIGAQLGDEGKGRIIDNKISQMSHKFDDFYVIRSQGGSNAGHTVQFGDKRIGLHQIPSAVFHKKAKLILDFGMVIHPEDLLTEIEIVENTSDSLKGRIFVSNEAMLCTDVERAKEILNRVMNGKAKEGTGRGMSPTTAGRCEKLGLTVENLVSDDWEGIFKNHYLTSEKLFVAYNEDLKDFDVPDFKKTKESGKAQLKKVGDLELFLKRLKDVREEILKRKIVIDTFLLNQEIYLNKTPVFFEMAQAVGLSPSFGTKPDTTSTETSALAINLGTRIFKYSEIAERIGVMKATYMSSVGARKMPTQVDDEWAHWVREFAHEYGTTTGRPRDICYIDLPFLNYNINMGEINQLAMTHLDVSRKNEKIKICIGYLKNGKEVYYKPDLEYLKNLEIIYVELDGWDSKECILAKSFEELPENAKKYIHFIESATKTPITVITNGPDRDNVVERL